MKVALGLALFVLLGTAGAAKDSAQVAAVRRQFTPAQWKQLTSLRQTSLILPAYVPPGYRVSRVEVAPLRGEPASENYDIYYSDGVHTLDWNGRNLVPIIALDADAVDDPKKLAGIYKVSDPEPQAFLSSWNSPSLGKGVVTKINFIGNNPAGESCWRTNHLARGETYPFAHYNASGNRTFFALRACDPSLAPNEVSRMMQSTVVVKAARP